MLERCSGMVNSQELPEQHSGVQKMSSSVPEWAPYMKKINELFFDSKRAVFLHKLLTNKYLH